MHLRRCSVHGSLLHPCCGFSLYIAVRILTVALICAVAFLYHPMPSKTQGSGSPDVPKRARSPSRSPSVSLSQGSVASAAAQSPKRRRKTPRGVSPTTQVTQKIPKPIIYHPEDVKLEDWLDDVMIVDRKQLKFDLTCTLGQSRYIDDKLVQNIREDVMRAPPPHDYYHETMVYRHGVSNLSLCNIMPALGPLSEF